MPHTELDILLLISYFLRSTYFLCISGAWKAAGASADDDRGLRSWNGVCISFIVYLDPRDFYI